MNVSKEGLRFIGLNEGLRLSMYRDSAGIPSIGYGHVIRPDDDFGMTITEEKAMELLHEDVGFAEEDVTNAVTVPLKQYQFDALASFTFNVGGRNLMRSTLLKVINANDFASVPAQLERWKFAGDQNGDGVVNQEDAIAGLVARRKREAKLFTEGDYGF